MGASKLETPIGQVGILPCLTYKREWSEFYRIKRSSLLRQNQIYRTKFLGHKLLQSSVNGVIIIFCCSFKIKHFLNMHVWNVQ